MPDKESSPVFTEIQKFAPWLLWFVRGTVLIALIVTFSTIKSTNGQGTSFGFLILFAIISLLPVLLIEFLVLTTRIDAVGINMRFRPFSKKSFTWDEVESAEVIDYGFVGGWGVRILTKYGTVYNTQGREGLWLKLKTGKQLVIGTQKRDEMESAVEVYCKQV